MEYFQVWESGNVFLVLNERLNEMHDQEKRRTELEGKTQKVWRGRNSNMKTCAMKHAAQRNKEQNKSKTKKKNINWRQIKCLNLKKILAYKQNVNSCFIWRRNLTIISSSKISYQKSSCKRLCKPPQINLIQFLNDVLRQSKKNITCVLIVFQQSGY